MTKLKAHEQHPWLPFYSVPSYVPCSLCRGQFVSFCLWYTIRLLEIMLNNQQTLKRLFSLYFRVWKSIHTQPILTEFIITQIITLEWWMDCIEDNDKQVYSTAWGRKRKGISHNNSAPDYRTKEIIIQDKAAYQEF